MPEATIVGGLPIGKAKQSNVPQQSETVTVARVAECVAFECGCSVEFVYVGFACGDGGHIHCCPKHHGKDQIIGHAARSAMLQAKQNTQ